MTTSQQPDTPRQLIQLRDLSKEFAGGTRAVDRVTLDIAPGGVFGIVGHSGAGKSTLLRLINLLETPTSGTVTVNGQELTALGSRQLRAARRDIGMIFQQFNLFRSRTVLGNVAYPLRQAGTPRAQARDRAHEALRFVGLADQARRYPEQLSGGQRQRVGIARALATQPPVLLCDEATSALDPQTTGEVLALLRRVNDELGVTIVLITHEMEVVRALCDRMAVLDAGRIVETGPVREVFAAPQHPTTRAFVRSAVQASPLLDLLPAALRKHGVDEAVAASVLAEVSA
ncbi:methionine ABC transporter ATP-binding protein [Streptomyces yunnanensis]|uniref:methionine ABC transporter ATP-binding protein n=1 Tax=Streptomyces yunnanensis TaxID=156453 RepID=UPI0023AE7B13|nr:ATP-binding cassette domain-containing protein [Streptomyces yunnanensis]